jgi:hypothetical protein
VSREFKTSHLPPCPSFDSTPTSRPVASTRTPVLQGDFKESAARFHQRFAHRPLQERITLSQTKFLPRQPRPSNKPYLRPIQVPPPLSDFAIEILRLQAKLTEANTRRRRQEPTTTVPLIKRLSDPQVFFEPAVAPSSLAFRRKSDDREDLLHSRATAAYKRLEVFSKYSSQEINLSARDCIKLKQLKDQVKWIIDFAGFAAQFPPERFNKIIFGLDILCRTRFTNVQVNYYTLVATVTSDYSGAGPFFTLAHVPHREFTKGQTLFGHVEVDEDYLLGW